MAKIDKNPSTFAMPASMERAKVGPLDVNSVWYDREKMETYAKEGKVAYVGQILSLVDEINRTVNVYKIVDTDGNLELIGTQADWEATEGVAEILNKPNMRSGVDAKGDLDTSAIVLAGNTQTSALINNGVAIGAGSIAGGKLFLVESFARVEVEGDNVTVKTNIWDLQEEKNEKGDTVGYKFRLEENGAWYGTASSSVSDSNKKPFNAFVIKTAPDDRLHDTVNINYNLIGYGATNSSTASIKSPSYTAQFHLDENEENIGSALNKLKGKPISFQRTNSSESNATVAEILNRDNNIYIVKLQEPFKLSDADGLLLSKLHRAPEQESKKTFSKEYEIPETDEYTIIIEQSCVLQIFSKENGQGRYLLREIKIEIPAGESFTTDLGLQEGNYLITDKEVNGKIKRKQRAYNTELYKAGVSLWSPQQPELGTTEITAFMNNPLDNASTVIGINSIARTPGALALGSSCIANGRNSFAAGSESKAFGQLSFAFGQKAEASQEYAIAIGQTASAIAIGAIAIGRMTSATGDGAVALGKSTKAIGAQSFAFGNASIATGAYSMAGGNGSTASYCSFAFGEQAKTTGSYSFSFGKSTTVESDYSFSFGKSTTAESDYSFAFGYLTKAQAENSFAFGNSAEANNLYSLAFGDYPVASGKGSLAFGCRASQNYNDGIGIGTVQHMLEASGDYSFAFGRGSQAKGKASFAFGAGSGGNQAITSKELKELCTIASGSYSFAFGAGIHTTNAYEVAFGKYNLTDGNTIFSIGNGESGGRKNLFQINQDGTVYIMNLTTGALMNLQELLNSLSTT